MDRFPYYCGVPLKTPLPVAFADENRRAGRKLRNTDRCEGATAKGCDSKNLEVVFGDNEDAGKLRIARAGTQQPQFSRPGTGRRSAPANHAAGVRKRHACNPKGDKAAEGMD